MGIGERKKKQNKRKGNKGGIYVGGEVAMWCQVGTCISVVILRNEPRWLPQARLDYPREQARGQPRTARPPFPMFGWSSLSRSLRAISYSRRFQPIIIRIELPCIAEAGRNRISSALGMAFRGKMVRVTMYLGDTPLLHLLYTADVMSTLESQHVCITG